MTAGASRTGLIKPQGIEYPEPAFDPAERYREWFDLITQTTGRGVAVRRARIVSEPVTDYIRFEHDVTAGLILGMTVTLPLEDRYLLTDSELKDRLAVLLGGRAAEEIAFSHLSTGAQDDLQKATDIARAMVVEYGMSERIGPLSFGRDGFRGGDGRMLFPGEGPQLSAGTAING